MNAGGLLDAGIAALLVAVAAAAITARTTFAAVVAFVAFGLVMALAWVALAAVDVALTEAAVGALTGVLLLSAVARLRASEPEVAAERPGRALRTAAALLCAGGAAALAAVVFALPEPAPSLAPEAARRLPETDLGNPVTAVLLAFRAIDTLLEKVVLLVGLLAVWSLAPDRLWGGRPGPPPHDGDDALRALARWLPPLGIVVGVYLVWNGSEHPGGAFPGSAMLAAMWVVARMAGLVDAPAVSERWLRVALAAGPLAFFAAGFAGFAWAGAFLAWPHGFAKPLIVAIEVPMTLSVAAALALLLEGPPARQAEPRR